MKNPYQEMLENHPAMQVLLAAAKSNKLDIDTAAGKLTGEQITTVGIWMSQRLRVSGVESTLVCGCFLYLYDAIASKEDRQHLFDSLIDDVGISRTQCFRNVAVWKVFGATLTQEMDLARKFSAESLKILAEEQTPQEARNTAIELARSGTSISIKKARSLQQEHTPVTESEPKKRSRRTRAAANLVAGAREANCKTALFAFVGDCIRLVVEPASPASSSDVADIIKDLEAALEQFRTEYGQQAEWEAA